jgi:hypothetical protein
MESVKFFQVDNTWMDALLDGALSIGRQYTGTAVDSPSLIPEQAHRQHMASGVSKALPNIRRKQIKGTALGDDPVSPVITGFLLRSRAVSGWPNMDVACYPKGASPYDFEIHNINSANQIVALDVLRLETLSPTVLIGLYSGSVYELVIHQPPEAIHFGFLTADPVGNVVQKSLRVPTPGWDDVSSYNTDENGYVNLPFQGVFTDNNNRVLDHQKMSQLIGQTFNTKGPAPGYFQAQGEMLSSDYGLEMVQGVGLVSFINDTPA